MFSEEHECDIACYADDNTPYTYDADIATGKSDCTVKMFKWFKENHLEANGDKCNLLVSTDKQMSINIECNIITSSQKENLFVSTL